MKATDKRPAAQDAMLGYITGYWVSQVRCISAASFRLRTLRG